MKKLIFALIILLSLSSCVFDNGDKEFAERNTITFVLVGSAGNDTRSEGESAFNENKIGSVDVFFYDTSGDCVFYPLPSQVSRSDDSFMITVPEDALSDMLNRQMTLFILANSSLSRSELSILSLDQLKERVYDNPVTFNRTASDKPEGFLMSGYTDVRIISNEQYDLGEIKLERAAAKIKVSVTDASIEGYTAMNAEVRISNYLDKTVMSKEPAAYAPQRSDYKTSPFRPVWIPNSGTEPFVTVPFYSYANMWEYDPGRETYVTIAVDWHKNATGEIKRYYYRVPLVHLTTPDDGSSKYQIKRNNCYELEVKISVLGGLDPEDMLELTPNFRIRNWFDNEIVIDLTQYEFLFVEETEVAMHDFVRKDIKYTSSKPVRIEVDSVFYYKYESSGDIRLIKRLPGTGDPFYPSLTLDEVNNLIKIDSPVPINYVPVMIHFKVINTAGLFHNVRVTQYPRQYVTSSYSTGVRTSGYATNYWTNSGNGQPHSNPEYRMTNFNFYNITTTSLSPSDPFVIGDPTHIVKDDDVKDPDTGQWGFSSLRTKRDEESNNMISPNFIVASQRGITSVNTSHSHAERRCAIYNEGPYPKGTWRVPTRAELIMISRIQRDTNSAMKGLFMKSEYGHKNWWCARYSEEGGRHFYSVNVIDGVPNYTFVPWGGDLIYNSVRCVHDVWKD